MINPNLSEQRKKILVVDDHQLILGGTFDLLTKQYPKAKILTAKTSEEAINQLSNFQPDLVVVDLSIPEKQGMIAQIDTGIQLIQTLIKKFPDLNLMVQSGYPKALARIRHDIDNHQGGFVVADKELDDQQRLIRVHLALEGGTHTRDLGIKMEIKPEWFELLRLAFEEGLIDDVIAERMNVSRRTVRNYWIKIQDVLGIYPEDCKQDGKNLRTETMNRAREEGLID